MRGTATVEACMLSTHLPGKTLMPLLDKTVLYWVIERVRRSRQVDDVVVATTANPVSEEARRMCWDELRGMAKANSAKYASGTIAPIVTLQDVSSE